MRIRSIKPEFWRSTDIADLPRDVRLLFIGLWSYVDDNGVGFDDHRAIAADLFGLEDDPVGARTFVRDGLARLHRAFLIARYTVDGKHYLFINTWDKHQKIDRPSKPRYPRPEEAGVAPSPPLTSDDTTDTGGLDEPSRDTRDSLDAGTGEQGNRGAGEQGGGARAKARSTTRGTRIPDDFAATPAMVEWARENTPDVGRVETDKFVDYWRSATGKNAVKRDWTAAWRNWMRRAQQDHDQHRPPRGSPPNGHQQHPTDANIARLLGGTTTTTTPNRALPGGDS